MQETSSSSSRPAGGCCFYGQTPSDLAPDGNVGLLIRHLNGLIHRIIDLDTLPLGLTANQWRPLLLIKHKNIDTPAELARAIGVDTGAMTRMLDRLEAKGFLHRERCRTDRRVVKVALTDTGHTLADQILPIIAGALNLHLQGFSDDEIHALLVLLRRMIRNGEHHLQSASEASRE